MQMQWETLLFLIFVQVGIVCGITAVSMSWNEKEQSVEALVAPEVSECHSSCCNPVEAIQEPLESNLEWFTQEHSRLLDAICLVESGCDSEAVGDGGDSIGAYQIQRAYWQDAADHDSAIGGKYEDVRNNEYARRVIISYWDRYGARAGYDIQALARIHNGGPRGHQKEATIKYWHKILYAMTKTNQGERERNDG